MIEKIRRAIEIKGVSQDAVERAIGLPQGRISKWLNDKGEPTIKQALRLSRYLDLSLEYMADDAMDDPTKADSVAPMTIDQARILGAVDALELSTDEAIRRLRLKGEPATLIDADPRYAPPDRTKPVIPPPVRPQVKRRKID